jgi:uncharacterized protein
MTKSTGLFRRTRLLEAGLVAVVFWASPGLAQQPGPGAGGAPGGGGPRVESQTAGPRIKALMVAGGCCHDYPVQGAILMKAVQSALPVDWSYAYVGGTSGRHVPELYNDPNWFEGYDVVVHNECFTPPDAALPPGYLDNTARATEAGIPAIFIHCAMHTFRDAIADNWRDVQGVKSVRHGRAFNIPVRIVAPEHEVMQGIRSDWVTPVDELYVLDWMRPGTVSLAEAVEPADGRTHTLIWVHEAQGARVFGTTLGHGMDTWNDPVFQQLLVQGFRWAVQR